MVNNRPTELIIDKAIGAMLGAACGDALGWPNERVGRSSNIKQSQVSLQEFRQWKRRTGGRFYPHEEIIEAGEYSDDTQLILCLSRCLQSGQQWWQRWTTLELPFWNLYERGGGGATKRAAYAWTDGNAPWSSGRNQKDIKRYFEAGGNGVAMRVLPHTLYHVNIESFKPVARNVMLDGIATHGHPRALVGALAYCFALWKSLRRESRLEYGEIADDLLTNLKEWATLPDISEQYSDWLLAADHFLSGYHKVWDVTVKEMETALSVCKTDLEKGALTIDDEALRSLQCFDRKVSGAGTVAAAAAVYLASRYAPDPIHGISKAAFAIGSDTDTIASMTGGLLGTVSGSTWLSSIKDMVQDALYLTNIANDLVLKKNRQVQPKITPGIRRNALKKWIDDLTDYQESANLHLPDGRKGVVYPAPDQIGKSRRYKIQFRKVVSEDGQSLYFKRISKGEFQNVASPNYKNNVIRQEAQHKSKSMSCGAKIPVHSLEKALWFYKDILCLNIKKKSQEVVVFDQGLVLVPKSYSTRQINSIQFRALLFIEVTDIQRKFSLINDSGLKIITPINPWSKSERLFFRCVDMDGNVVEVFAAEQY